MVVSLLCLLDGQVLRDKPLIRMESRYRLLGSCNEILVVGLITINNLVQLFIEVIELSGLCHVVLQHELRSLQRAISALRKEFKSIIDKCLVQEHAPLSQEVATMANDLHTTVRIVAIKTKKHLVMGENITLLDRDTFRRPSALDSILILCVALASCIKSQTRL